MSKNWVRNMAGGLSFASALFIFQACYGTPQDLGLDVLIEGQVKSLASGLPIKGIQVSVADSIQVSYTDDEGYFSFYTDIHNDLKLSFQDVDSVDNGRYAEKDTTLIVVERDSFLNISLEDQ